jgi:SAM-dependent methyltransferase
MSNDTPNSRQVADNWDLNAPHYDAVHGDEGNRFHQGMVEPSVLELLALRVDERVLDIGCGNGVLARKLASLGARVVATDYSQVFLDAAIARSTSIGAERLTFARVDATDAAALAALGPFDAAVSTMALMDIPDIVAVFAGAYAALSPGGRFVVATAHPVFNAQSAAMYIDVDQRDGGYAHQRGFKITSYLTQSHARGIGMRGQPAPQWYFHRPLHALLTPAFDAGFVLDGLREIASPNPPRPDVWDNWANFKEFPAVLTMRLRKA